MAIIPVILSRKRAANGAGSRIPRWVKITIIVFLLLIMGILGINMYLKATVNNRLRSIVSESSHGLYKLDYSDISLNALTGSLKIYSVKLTPDSVVLNRLLQQHAAPRFVYQGTVAQLAFSNIKWLVFLNSKKLNIGTLKLAKPNFNIIQYLQKHDTARQVAGMGTTLNKDVRDLRVSNFTIENAMVNYQVKDTIDADRTVNIVEDLNVELKDLRLKKSKEGFSELKVEKHHITLKDFKHRTADSLYWIGVKNLDYDSDKKRATLAMFYTQPRFAEKEFARKKRTQSTRYEVAFKNISAEDINIASIILKGEVIVKKLNIESGNANMFMDRSLPSINKDDGEVVISKKIKKLPLPFAIDQLTIGSLGINYKEYNPLTEQSAQIPFQKLSIKAVNVTNLPDRINRNATMTLGASGQFMNAQMKANFTFDLSSSDGSFTAGLVANEIPATDLSPILTAVAKIETRKGTLEKLEASVAGNEKGATADVTLLYRGLKISMLKKDGDTLKRRGLPTMLANLFVIDDNPKDGILRTAKNMRLARRPGRSFFNMVWNVIALGIKDIITDKKGYKLDAV